MFITLLRNAENDVRGSGYNTISDNDKRLIKFCIDNNLILTNILYAKGIQRNEKLITDYVIITFCL